MTIEFGQLAQAHTDMVVGGRLVASGMALGFEITETGAVVAGRFGVGGYALLFQQDSGVEPPLPTMVAGTLYTGGSFEGFGYETFPVEGGLGYSGVAFDLDMGAGVTGMAVAGGLNTRAAMREFAPALNYGFFVEPEPIMVGYGGIVFVRQRERIRFSSPARHRPTLVARERLGLGGRQRPMFEGTVPVSERLVFGSDGEALLFALVQDRLLLGAVARGEFTAFIRTVERLLLAGSATNVADAVAQVVDALVLRALVDAAHVGHAADTLLLASHIDSLYSTFARVVERLLLSATPSPSYTATAIVRETLVLAGGAAHEAELTAAVRDAIAFAANIRVDNGEYIAWVLNTESKGLTRYTHYPYNSFARIGGRYVGCAPDGLHWLDGDTDNGEDIHARLRLGMSDLGTRKLKRIPECFIGYTSDGVLLLKAVIANEESGEREAAIYRLRPRPAQSKRENRFKLGRGLVAVDWDFEIENVDGADFDLSSVEFRPLILDRRTRG